jgi:NTP pyrophosphatase (non-canonical NTP hydrolase)
VSGLTFEELRLANRERCESPTGFNSPIISWSPTDWACALAGEVGEACNDIKKLRRLATSPESPMTTKEHEDYDAGLRRVGRELADVVCYVDLLCQRLGIDLGEMTRIKFNEVSERCGSKVRL